MRSRSGAPPGPLAAIALAWGLAGSGGVLAGEAEVAVSLATEDPPWAGQQVTVNLDLKTGDLSFANVFFDLPQVEGGFLLRTDSGTIKLSERRDGETWQVLRYPVALFPQAGGTLTVPAFEVRFDTTAGFGSDPTAHVMSTTPLEVTVRRPPGMNENALVVTTRDHELRPEWTRPTDPVEAGDAFTLTVQRRAADLSAMLLPPLPVYETEGLAAYPDAPVVRDRSNRGQLVGERTDRITWVVEQPGDYAIPAIRFQWWDPVGERLRDVTVPGQSFEAAPAPGAPPVEGVTGAEHAEGRGVSMSTVARVVLALVAVTLLAGIGWRHRAALRRLGRRILPPPRALLKTLNPDSRTP